MVHGESHLILWHGITCKILYKIDMFLLKCDCEMLSEHCMYT